jgi:hypothetical protein
MGFPSQADYELLIYTVPQRYPEVIPQLAHADRRLHRSSPT